MNLNIENIINNPYENGNKLTVKELEEIISLANDKYYNTQEPIFEDNIYDILVDFLKLKHPKSKILKKIGAPVKNKGIKLDYYMPSLNKIKPTDIKDFNKWINSHEPSYKISDKLDGISCLLIYRNNNTINMYTRGNGNTGSDISNFIKYMNIPTWIDINDNLKVKANKENILLAIRGEIIMKQKTFNEKWLSTMKNVRNSISGLLASKNINIEFIKDVDLVTYEIIDPKTTYEDQLSLLKQLGFKTVKYKSFSNIDFNILSEYFKERRNKSKYTVDGIVVTNNELHEMTVKGNPSYAFAFKEVLEEQISITKVIKIEWNKSKDGYIKPTLIVNPVNIGGVEINRVTANNAKFIVDNNIGINTEIEIIRSGDVIPKIKKIIKSTTVQLPEGKWHWNKTKVDIIADDLESQDIIIKNIYHFFSHLNAKGLGEKVIEKLVNTGYDTVKKIILLNVEDIIKINGFKNKSSENLVNSIKKSITNINLGKFMTASNKLGHGIGLEKINIVLQKYDLLEEAPKWTTEEFINNLKQLNGWEETTSKLFVLNFKNFMKFYESIKSLVTFEKKENKKIIKSKYTDKIIVMSGFRDAVLKEKLESMGAIITNSISKNTDYLIVKNQSVIDNKTEKVIKAIKLNIPIITIEQVFN